MSDKQARQYFRNGDWVRWHAALLRSGHLTIYSEPAGPPSILEVKCAIAGCDEILTWSNCSYCSECHTEICFVPENEITVKCGLNWGDINIKVGETYSCGAQNETDVLEFYGTPKWKAV